MDDRISSPLSTLRWIDRWDVKPNDYNPNVVSKQNLELLKQSILTNGWTLPIVVRPDMTIIDGFHRWTVAGEEPLKSMLDGKVPVVIVDHKDKAGNMLYGYARLPYVDYQPALLSARRPVYDKGKGELRLEVQNFGLSASKAVEVEVRSGRNCLGRVQAGALQPYETVNLSLKPASASFDEKSGYEVVFLQDGVEVEKNVFE